MSRFISGLLICIVRWYQRWLSPDHSYWARAASRPPHCKYTPSCSQYMIEAIEKKWPYRGLLKGIWRIIRCNPWSKGGYDPAEKE